MSKDTSKTETVVAETDIFAAALEKGKPGRKASGNAKPEVPRVAEVPPAEMAGLLKLKEFHSKGQECDKVQVTQTRFPSKLSCDLAEAGTVGLQIVDAICEKLGPGRKGVGYTANEVAARMAKHSRLFAEGEGLCLQTQAWSPAFACPKGQDAVALKEGATTFLTRLAKGIESGDPGIVAYVETRKEEGIARRAKWEVKQAAAKAAKAEKAAADKAAKAD